MVAPARRVRDIGRRHADPNLVAGGDLFEGRALVKQGRMAEGMALLDEAMLAVLSGELDPGWAGNVYCHLMAAFHELADVRRAAEWTEATSRWVAGLPPAVLFTGICRVHRSQVLERRGAWAEAEREAALVCEDLADLHVAGAAEGHYQLGDIRRLRGDLAGAEAAYRHAHELGRDPQPGLALLRLAQGRAATASASIRAALTAVTHDRLGRARLCAAQVEIALAAGDAETAGLACDELTRTASTYGSSGLEAAALQARGAVLLAGGRAEAALPTLRAACRRWRELDAPYDAARVRLLLAGAYQALGDADAAMRELDAAEVVFRRLGRDPGRRGDRGQARPGGAARRPDRARGGGAGAGRRRPLQPGGRRGAGAQPQDRRPAPVEHLRQARRELADPGGRLRLRARPGRPGAWVGRPIGRPRLHTLPDAPAVPALRTVPAASRRAGRQER